MRKALLFAPMMILCLLLTGCGGGEKTESRDLQAAFRELTSAQAEAELTCHYGDEVRFYGMTCVYTPQRAEVTVTAPEELAGVSAVLDGDTLSLAYDGILLDAGVYSGQGISPFLALPATIRALGEGYLLEESEEQVGEIPCRRLCLEMTEDSGEKTLYTVWLDGEGSPVRGEIAMEDVVVYALEFTGFTAESPEGEEMLTKEQNNGTAAEENLGGD